MDSCITEETLVSLHRGDWVIPSSQPAKRYLTEVLSPFAHDAFLVWNFFDAALQRKEYFSGYVFEDLAADMLAQDEDLRATYAAMQRRTSSGRTSPRGADVVVLPKRTRRRDGVSSSSVSRAVTIF